MKKVILMILALILLNCTAFAAECFNAQGSAIVPGMYTRNASSTAYHGTRLCISNITGNTVTCKVTVYDQAGNDVSGTLKVLTGSDTAGNVVEVAATNGEFTLSAYETRMVDYYALTSGKCSIGHAVIEWKASDAKLRRALVVGARAYGRSGSSTYYAGNTYINGGQPF